MNLDLAPLPNFKAEAFAASQYEHKRDPSLVLPGQRPSFIFSQLAVNIDVVEPNFIYVFAHDPLNLASNPVGFAKLSIDEPASYIHALFVEESVRGLGVGEGLLNRCFKLSRDLGKVFIGLSVKKENEGARRLYERVGFKPYLDGHEGYAQLIKQL